MKAFTDRVLKNIFLKKLSVIKNAVPLSSVKDLDV